MIKIFTILFAIIAMIYSFNWLASFSGEVLFILGDYEVKISPLFFIISSVAIIALSILFFAIIFGYQNWVNVKKNYDISTYKDYRKEFSNVTNFRTNNMHNFMFLQPMGCP